MQSCVHVAPQQKHTALPTVITMGILQPIVKEQQNIN